MPDRSTCESVVRQLWPYIDGQLAATEREQIVAHLQACGRCQSHMDFAAAFLEALERVGPRAIASDALRARVTAALSSEGFR